MNRRDATFALLALGATPFSSFAQKRGKPWRIGFLAGGPRAAPAFRECTIGKEAAQITAMGGDIIGAVPAVCR